MSTPIEIQGMTLSIDWYRDSNDNLHITDVDNIGNSWDFLVENIDHPALNEFQSDTVRDRILDFYQLPSYDQWDIIKEMLEDGSFNHHFEDKCYIDKDTHFALKEDCY